MKLRDCAQLIKSRVGIEEANTTNYVSTDNMLPNRGGIKFGKDNLPKAKTVNYYQKGDILMSNIRPYFKKVWFADRDGTRSSDVLCFRAHNTDVLDEYLYCILQSDHFFKYVVSTSKGTKMPRGDKKAILNYEFDFPSKEEQYRKYSPIMLIEKKIRLNRHINDNLDAVMTIIFEEQTNNDNFSKAALTDIATYKNGLAMQKYRPNDDEQSLPVLKIKELNQGYTDDFSDKCSAKIDKNVIVNTGDIIFSWSGTLLVKNWAGKTAGLNQHLFKVTSNDYPKWFIYEWTKYHLRKFQSIAAGKATTMGHIKKSDLKSSKVLIPNENRFKKLDVIMKPLYDKRIEVIKENQRLSELKHILLKKYF